MLPYTTTMINLPKDEIYEIKTVEDLLNCPLNMQMDLISVILETFKARIVEIETTGKDQEIINVVMSVTNDGEYKTNLTINRLKES